MPDYSASASPASVEQRIAGLEAGSPSPVRRAGWSRVTTGLAAMVLITGLAGAVSAAGRLTAVSGAVPSRDIGERRTPAAAFARFPGTPVSVRIPAIGVDASLDTLGLTADGALQVPPYDRAGWFGGGAKPGENGPAVIAAHVDSKTGPSVFYRLKALQAGDAVTVLYDDARTVTFVVTGAASYSKSDFPTERVYGPTKGPELRLITCGGRFDRRAGSYVENLVVSATAATQVPSV